MYDSITDKILLNKVERRLSELRKEYRNPESKRSKQAIAIEAKSLIKTKERLLAKKIAT